MAPQSSRREKKLNAAEVAIENALSRPDIRSVIEKYSYTRSKLEAGNALRKAALEAHRKQQLEYGEQTAATHAVDEAWEAANKIYMHQIKVARLAFKRNEGALAILGLNEPRKDSFSGWYEQAGGFYSSLANRPDLAEQLAVFGVTADELAEAQRAVDAASAADKAQTQEKGDAQRATVACDAAMDALDEWMSDFVEMARIAFEDDEQRLEYLGITARS